MEKKKKKVIKDITFDHTNGHVALVGPAVGGPANMEETVLLKAGEGFTDEIIEKATKVQVTLSIEEYLTRFFGLYWSEAEALALALGFTVEASEAETFDYAEDYREYLNQKVGSIKVMKSLKEDNEFVDVISKMNGEEYLKFLQDQEMLEKAFAEVEVIKQARKVKVKESGTEATASEPDTQQNSRVEKSVEPSGSEIKKNRKQTMTTKEVKTVVADVEKDLVEKSAYDAIQKALEDQGQELTKALAIVKQFEQEKKDAITKSRKEKLDAVVKNKEQSEVLFKALNLVEDATEFDAVVKALADIQKLADQSDLFKSVGADGAPEVEVTKAADDINSALIARLEAKKK